MKVQDKEHHQLIAMFEKVIQTTSIYCTNRRLDKTPRNEWAVKIF